MKKNKKRCVISGYYGFKNFGDEAILSVLVNKLQKDGHTVTVISSNPNYTKSKFSHVLSFKTFDFKNIIAAIFKSQVIISGGGSLLQDITSKKSLLYYLSIIFLGLILRKQVIIFAQGIGPINNKLCLYLTMALLKLCKYVSVRDQKSYEILKKNGISADLLCDPIFSLRIQEVKKEKKIAIQLRNCKGMNADFINRLADTVCKNFPGYGIDIYSFQDEIDYNTCELFEKNLNMLDPDMKTKLYSQLTNEEIIQNISKAEYLIAMRFHAIIIGLLTSTKTLAINYDIKVEKLASEFELPIINMRTDHKKQFKELKEQNTEKNASLAKSKEFDWSCFESAMEWE